MRGGTKQPGGTRRLGTHAQSSDDKRAKRQLGEREDGGRGAINKAALGRRRGHCESSLRKEREGTGRRLSPGTTEAPHRPPTPLPRATRQRRPSPRRPISLPPRVSSSRPGPSRSSCVWVRASGTHTHSHTDTPKHRHTHTGGGRRAEGWRQRETLPQAPRPGCLRKGRVSAEAGPGVFRSPFRPAGPFSLLDSQCSRAGAHAPVGADARARDARRRSARSGSIKSADNAKARRTASTRRCHGDGWPISGARTHARRITERRDSRSTVRASVIAADAKQCVDDGWRLQRAPGRRRAAAGA